MTQATEAQKSAYQQQWESMDDRSSHAVKLVEMAHQFLELMEEGTPITRIEEIFSGIPELNFSATEIEFAILAAMRVREHVLRSLASKIYSSKGVVDALVQHQTENVAIALERLKEDV